MSETVIQMAGSASSLCCAWRKLQTEGYRRRKSGSPSRPKTAANPANAGKG